MLTVFANSSLRYMYTPLISGGSILHVRSLNSIFSRIPLRSPVSGTSLRPADRNPVSHIVKRTGNIGRGLLIGGAVAAVAIPVSHNQSYAQSTSGKVDESPGVCKISDQARECDKQISELYSAIKGQKIEKATFLHVGETLDAMEAHLEKSHVNGLYKLKYLFQGFLPESDPKGGYSSDERDAIRLLDKINKIIKKLEMGK